jgi:hypothetical protein
VNPAHLHLILNHIAPIGLPIGLVILLVGLLRRNDTIIRTSLWLFLILGALIIPTHMTGEPAEEVVEDMAGVSRDAIESHEDAAFFALLATVGLGIASFVALTSMRRNQSLSRPLGYGIVALALVSTGTLTWVAEIGGAIRHTEIRGGASMDEVDDDAGRQGRGSDDRD